MKAYVRKDLLDFGEYPPASIEITSQEWNLVFVAWQIDAWDRTPQGEFYKSGYNLLLLHPLNGKLFWSYSIDFDFLDCK